MTELTAPVGIGTANPVATLDIGGANPGGTLHINEPANATTITTPVQGAYIAWNALTGGTGETDFINNQGPGTGGFAFMNTPAAGTPRTTLMVITGEGNVGIGTPNPTSTLQVNGSLTVSASTGLESNIVLGGGSSGFSLVSSIAVPPSSVGIDEPPPFYTSGSQLSFSVFPIVSTLQVAGAPGPAPVEAMRIDQQGRLGIGTSTPAATLDVAGGTFHVSEPANPTNITTPVQGGYIAWNALTGGTGETDFINNQGGGTGGFAFMNAPASGTPRTTLMTIGGDGTVRVLGTLLVNNPEAPGEFIDVGEAIANLLNPG
jgi:hypothetical protein